MAYPRNLDIDLLRTFVVIAAEQNISRAAERLLRKQSTISLQLKRLEELVGLQLCARTPRTVKLTHDGKMLLGYANRMLQLNDEALTRMIEPKLEGQVRLGAPEDFATTHLPLILGEFIRTHPLVSLEVTCDLTMNLMQKYRNDELDIALLKREPTIRLAGIRVWREPLVWVACDGFDLKDLESIPLVVSPEPCVYRKRAMQALKSTKRKFRIAYTCGSLAGNLAAVKSGLGISVLPKEMVPHDLHALNSRILPDLRDTEIALIPARHLSAPAMRLCDHIVTALERVS